MNINNTSSGKQYNNAGGGSQYNADNITIHHPADGSSDQDRQFLVDLKLSDPRLDKERIERTKGGLLKNSYLWILNNEDFKRWRADFQNRLLWVRGDPGKGKTMLLCGIVDELRKEKSAYQPIYFFFQATDTNLNTASAALRGILYLMLKKKSQLIKDLRENHDYSDRRLFDSINAWDTLCDMVTAVLEDESFQNAVILIDALDECTTDVEKLLEFINELSSKAVRIIVSSRNWPMIEREIAAATQQAAHISLELNETSISSAVVAFIDHKVNHLAQKHGYSAATRNLVCDTLVQNSDSTFLWAALVCRKLADSNINNWEVGSKLAEFPPGLDTLYARMLDQALSSTNGNLFRTILALTSVVFRPVDTAELRSLLGPLGSLFKEPRSLEIAVRQCGSFLTVRNDTVYFVHQSAKEFLLSNTAIAKVMTEGIVCEHALIWMNSLQVMSTTFRSNMYDLETPSTPVDAAQPPVPDPLASVRYSCTHWIQHFCTTKWIEPCQAELMGHFFEHSFLHWAEALCLLGAVYNGVESMKKLSYALKDTAGYSKLAALVQDAFSFLQKYQNVIEKAPLQIYCSVLLFSPRKCLVRELYLREVPDWILTKPFVKEEEWDTRLQVFGHHDQCQTLMFSPDGHYLVSTSLNDMKLWDAGTGQCLRTIKSPGGQLGQVTLSYDGLLVAAIVGDFQCMIWNVKTGDCLQTLQHHSGKIKSIALSYNSRTLVMGSEDRTVRLWNIETGICLWGKIGHDAPVVAVVFSPDGCTLASGATSIKIWNTETGEYLNNVQPDFNSELCSILYTNGGRRIVSISWIPSSTWMIMGLRTCSIRVWETSTGNCLRAKDFAARHTAAARTSVSLSPHNGGIVASPTFEKTVEMWDLGRSEQLSTIVHPYRFAGISISSDGERLAIVSDQGTVRLHRLINLRHQPSTVHGQPLIPMSPASSASSMLNWRHFTPSDPVVPITLSPRKSRWSFRVRFWKPRGTYEARDIRPIQSVNLSVNGERAISVQQGQDIVDVWETRSGRWLQGFYVRVKPGTLHLPYTNLSAAAAFTREQKIFFATTNGSKVVIVNATGANSLPIIAEDSIHHRIIRMVFSGDATKLAILSCSLEHGAERFIRIWSLEKRRFMWQFCFQDGVKLAPSYVSPISLSSFSSQTSFTQWFSQSGSELHTSYGTIDLIEPAAIEARSTYDQISKSTPPGYYIEGQWIMKDLIRVLWLPEEYRPWNGVYVVRESALAIGCESGQVIFFKFSSFMVEPAAHAIC